MSSIKTQQNYQKRIKWGSNVEQLRKRRSATDVRKSERKEKQPAKLEDCGDCPNFPTHVGTVVDVFLTVDVPRGGTGIRRQ